MWLVVLVGSDDTELVRAVNKGTLDARASPFVLGIECVGIRALDHGINAVILIGAWSGANSFCMRAVARCIVLRWPGQAPRVLETCSKAGVSYLALLCTAALSCLAYLSVWRGSKMVFVIVDTADGEWVCCVDCAVLAFLVSSGSFLSFLFFFWKGRRVLMIGVCSGSGTLWS